MSKTVCTAEATLTAQGVFDVRLVPHNTEAKVHTHTHSVDIGVCQAEEPPQQCSVPFRPRISAYIFSSFGFNGCDACRVPSLAWFWPLGVRVCRALKTCFILHVFGDLRARSDLGFDLHDADFVREISRVLGVC